MGWMKQLFSRRRRYDELSESIRDHLDEKIAELMDRGITRSEAESKARREFGNVTLIEQRSREVWQWPSFESILADIKYALRQLLKSPGFTITAILTLMLAIGANTAVFSLLDALLLRSLPVHKPQELVFFRHELGSWPAEGFNSSGWDNVEFSYPIYDRFHQQQKLFSDIFGYASLGFKEKNIVLRMSAEASEVTGTMVTGTFFEGLGVTAALGRAIEESDVSSAAPRVAVISYGLWQRAFAASPATVGQSITLNNIPYTIIGVAAPGFTGVQPGIRDDLWIPVTDAKALAPWGSGGLEESATSSERWWWLTIVGRLRPGVTKEQAAAALSPQFVTTLTVLKGSTSRSGKLPFIKLDDANRGMPFMEELYAKPAKFLMGLVVLVLLAACANLATLLLARGRARSREIAVRLAIGASRARVWRQLLTESILLSVTGGSLGILAAPIAMRTIASGFSQGGDRTLDLTLDYRVLFFTALLCILTGVLFGIAPALRSGRMNVNSTLKDDAGTESTRSSLSMRLLVVVQATISTFLLIVCGIFLHSLSLLYSQRTGFDEDHLLIFHLAPMQSGYTPAQLPALYARIEQRLASLPGVRSATSMTSRFMSGWKNNFDVEIEGYDPPDRRQPNILNDEVGPRFLATAGIPLLQGRDFAESDTATSPKVAIINESLAKKYFEGRNPIGLHITFKPWDGGKKPISYMIVGICRDALYYSLRNEPQPTWYQAMTQEPDNRLESINFMLRTEGNPTALATSARVALREVDQRLVADDVRTQSEQIDASLGSERTFALVSAFFGGLALLLATIGLYGTLAYNVSRRQREIGIRIALGAQRQRLLRMFLWQGLALVLLGIAIGCGASALAGRLLASMIAGLLFGVHTFDPLSFLGAAVILIALAGVAALVPARRATSTDPMQALRTE